MTEVANATSLRIEMRPVPCSRSTYRPGSGVGAVVIVAVDALVTTAVGATAVGPEAPASVGPGDGRAATVHDPSSASAMSDATKRQVTKTA